MNYTTLVSSIESFLENTETDFVAYIPQFVKNAEDKINKRVQLPKFRKESTGTLTASQRYLTLSSDFLSPYSFAVKSGDDHSYLKFVEDSFLREAYPDDTSEGLPVYYALQTDAKIILGPVPDSNYSYSLTYFYKPESIVTASTSWIGDNAENALLWGSIVQAYTYLKGDAELLAAYQKQFDEAINELQLMAEGRARKDTYKAPNQKLPT